MTTSRTSDTKTVNGLMAMFYQGAAQRGSIHIVPQGEMFTLTAKQFSWLKDVSQREDGFLARGRGGYVSVQGEIPGVGCFEANEQKYGSATVILRS
jgi:hypothetical protein